MGTRPEQLRENKASRMGLMHRVTTFGRKGVCVCLEGAHVLLHYRVQIRDAQRPLEKLLPKRQSGLCVFMRRVGQ